MNTPTDAPSDRMVGYQETMNKGLATAPGSDSSRLSSDAPVTVIHPSRLLTFLAAIFRPAAAPTFGELAGILLPFTTLIVSTLTDTTS